MPQSSISAIAVIIPVLNAARSVHEALQSLAAQTLRFEATLIDGGSSDETVAIASAFPDVNVISAPGTSIYEAINRGIEAARAPAICLLNADDAMLPGALAAFADALAR